MNQFIPLNKKNKKNSSLDDAIWSGPWVQLTDLMVFDW